MSKPRHHILSVLVQNKAGVLAREASTAKHGTEEQARQAAARANLEAALGIQTLGTQTGMQGMLANQQAMLEAQRMGEQSRQFGAQNQLAAFGQAGQMGQTLGNLGTLQQQADLSRLGAQTSAAAQQQALVDSALHGWALGDEAFLAALQKQTPRRLSRE